MKKNVWAIVFIAIIGLCLAVFFYKKYKIPPAIDLPEIALTNLKGEKVNLRSYAGDPLFLSFFATWCGPCVREIPELLDMQAKLSDQRLQLVFISDEPVERLQSFSAHFGNRIVVLHSDRPFHDIGIYTYPTNYIFDATGKKVYEKVDPDDWRDTGKVKNLLK
jgi:peroxiredoxin